VIALFTAVFLLASFWVYRIKVKLSGQVKFYEDQGIHFSKRTRNLVGEMPTFRSFNKHIEGKTETLAKVDYVNDVISQELDHGNFSASKTPILGHNFMGFIVLNISDCETLQEFYTTKNKLIDKNGP
jgi:hypothetical protein